MADRSFSLPADVGEGGVEVGLDARLQVGHGLGSRLLAVLDQADLAIILGA